MHRGSSISYSHPMDATPFEAFRDGSWHGVDCIRIRNGGLFVKFNFYGSIVEDHIHGDYLRMRSRRVACFDCLHFLKPGVDVCVLSPHPLGASFKGETKAPLLSWRDAKLISVKRNPHAAQCFCLFAVIFYKNQCPSSIEKVITDRRAEVVAADNVCILQKLQCQEDEEGNMQWNSTEDCLSHNRSKLLSDRFSSEISTLIVLSTLRGMEFDIKLIEDKIIYQIIKGDQVRCGLDWSSIPPGFATNMEIMSFRQNDEALRPIVRNIPITHSKKLTLAEGVARFSLKSEMDSVLDVEILYEHVNLRRSKRLKTQPERFTSYDTPFDRIYKKKEAKPLPTENGNAPRASNSVSCVEAEPPSAQVPQKSIFKQITPGSLVVKGEAGSMELQLKSTPKKGTPSSLQEKEGTGSTVAKEKSIVEQRAPDSHVPQTPARNKEKLNYSLSSSQKLKSFTSTPFLKGISEPAFCKKRGRKRKKRITEREYKQMIDQCIGNIKNEMEKDFELNLQTMSQSQDAYLEEDFTWPPSSDSQEEEDELEELWKEMDYSLTALALTEQKQMPDSEIFDESTVALERSGEVSCCHDCVLNEELGLTCRLCNVVCIEAKHIFPQLFNGNGYHDRPGRSNFGYDNCMADPSLLSISVPEIAELKGSGTVWTSIPDLQQKLLPHQRKAFEFIWENLAGSLQVEEMDSSTASTGGCVVAHTPGSGKTLLLISFLVSYLNVFPRSRPLVITPKAAIHTWRREFEKWDISLPIYVLHQSNRKVKPTGTLGSKIQAMLKNFHKPSWNVLRFMDSLDKICKWHEQPSVLLMTYSSFLSLTKEDSKLQHRAFTAKVLMNNPGLLILDEGHNPRSTKSKLRRLLMKVKTEFRVLLSGTLFQNNFEEYFNTLSLARPRFVDDVITMLAPQRKKEYRGRRVKHQEATARNIFVESVGQMIESINECDKKQGIDLLNKLTCGFIDSFEGTKLNNLPGLHVYTLFMRPTDIQEEILAKLTMSASYSSRYPLEVELLITIGSIHPWLIQTTKSVSNYFSPCEIDKVSRYKQDFSVGCKAKFVVDLLHKSSFRGERVLIFCHNVSPINFLVELLEAVFGWRLGEEILVLQGDQELPIRSDVIDKFNGDSKGKRKVLLASTTACAEGISLTGASRLVMLDSEWNHSKTKQAIARAFRPGQEKMVYVYLLLASGTWEEDKYNSNRRKAWVSKMVFFGCYVDDPSPNCVTDINDEVLKELVDENETGTFDRIVKHD